ncbi:DUF3237 domain-containing protein [Sporosarcina sp. 179-K 3D1 HS]|uniref:DUF3237 domain-containing protein n=1 Tax=Sporosarcina sp. 179-K 3D1 HS TaxID=3232169 RepID=UPI00399FDB37
MDKAHSFQVKITVGTPIEIGHTGAGIRRVIPITGGTVEDLDVRGEVLPGGADYQLIRNDGVTEVVAHYVIRMDDGELIYVVNKGYRHGPPDIMEKLKLGEPVPDDAYYFKTTPVFETASETYQYLNRTIYVGNGIRRPTEVEITFREAT